MWSACAVFLCLVAASRQLSVTEFSVPASIEAGQDAELKCKYDLSENESDAGLFVKWWWLPGNGTSGQRIQLYQRIAGYDPAAIGDNVVIEGKDGIKLLNVSPIHSGIYECEVSNIDEVRQRQMLIVFSKGSGPLLNVSLVDDLVVATCEAQDVAPYPDISISLAGNVEESSGHVTGPIDGLYDIFDNVTFTVNEADGVEITCELFYNDNVTHPPYIVSQTFELPTGGSVIFSCSWMLLITTILPVYYVANN
ncbi:uncharacterized protein [Epargyreus clarus]|uniref:uncharacterized protein isoform X2 n=1 Tax=Epargyreus clarus TaxID=520877 RepID=UPI003C2E78EE